MFKTEQSMHRRPGPEYLLHHADRERLRDALLQLVKEVVATVTIEVGLAQQDFTITQSPYLPGSRIIPTISLSISADNHEKLRRSVSKVLVLGLEKGLAVSEKMISNGNGYDQTEPSCATLHISHWTNRHRTVR